MRVLSYIPCNVSLIVDISFMVPRGVGHSWSADPRKNIDVFFFVLFLISCMLGVISLLVEIGLGKASKIAHNWYQSR